MVSCWWANRSCVRIILDSLGSHTMLQGGNDRVKRLTPPLWSGTGVGDWEPTTADCPGPPRCLQHHSEHHWPMLTHYVAPIIANRLYTLETPRELSNVLLFSVNSSVQGVVIHFRVDHTHVRCGCAVRTLTYLMYRTDHTCIHQLIIYDLLHASTRTCVCQICSTVNRCII